MSKSKRTQERYQKQNKDQTSLTARFGFMSTKSAAAVKDSFSQAPEPIISLPHSPHPHLESWLLCCPLKLKYCHQVDLVHDQHLFCPIHLQMRVIERRIRKIHQVLLMYKRIQLAEKLKRRDLMSRKIMSPILRKPFKGQNMWLRIGQSFEGKSRLTWRSTARVWHYQNWTNTLSYPISPLSDWKGCLEPRPVSRLHASGMKALGIGLCCKMVNWLFTLGFLVQTNTDGSFLVVFEVMYVVGWYIYISNYNSLARMLSNNVKNITRVM